MNCENKTTYVVGISQFPADNTAAANGLIFYQHAKDLSFSGSLYFLIQQGEQRINTLGAVNPDFSTMKRVPMNQDEFHMTKIRNSARGGLV